MSKVSKKEVERQYRVLKQTLEMHAILRDRYAFYSSFSEKTLLVFSILIISTVFAKNEIYSIVGLDPDNGQIFIGFASVVILTFTILMMVFDWKKKSYIYDNAANRWAEVLKLFRDCRLEDDTWPESELSNLSKAYWDVDRNTPSIPASEFNGLKSKYLKKVAISKCMSKYPYCPKLILEILLCFSDSFKAIKDSINSEGGES